VGTLYSAERAGHLAKAVGRFEDLLALRSEGAGDHAHFAQALALLANLILER
jgi:hypothetical protein